MPDEIKEEAKFTQTDMNRVVQQRLEAEKAKQQREIAEIKKKEEEIQRMMQEIMAEIIQPKIFQEKI